MVLHRNKNNRGLFRQLLNKQTPLTTIEKGELGKLINAKTLNLIEATTGKGGNLLSKILPFKGKFNFKDELIKLISKTNMGDKLDELLTLPRAELEQVLRTLHSKR